MPKYLIPYARMITDAPLDAVPQISWGSAVLACLYRGLCMAVAKGHKQNGILLGCPLILQMWIHERFSVGQPKVDLREYDPPPEGHDPADRPTMGSLWCLRKVINLDFLLIRSIYVIMLSFLLINIFSVVCRTPGFPSRRRSRTRTSSARSTPSPTRKSGGRRTLSRPS